MELINSNITYFERHPLLLFELKNVTENGEVIPVLKNGIKVKDTKGNIMYKSIYKQAFYNGLDFKLYDTTEKTPYKRLTIEGSLHKYWNKGAHNFNDFGINEIAEVRENLKELFNIDFVNCILKQLEIAVNLLPPALTRKILRFSLLHKTNELKSIYTKDEGNYIQTKNQRHFIKLYDKRTHYQNKGFEIDKDIFRIEKKYSKMVELNNKGIYNLNDLIKHDLIHFKGDLLNLWNSVLFYDWTVLDGTKYKNTYSNVNYWLDLAENNYSNFKYHKRNLNNIVNKNPQNIKKKIAELISNKVDLLNSNTTQINPLYIGLKTVVSTPTETDKNRRICLVTGLNISMQKTDSILLSHTGIRYYLKTDLKVYNEIKRKYLSTKWNDAEKETQIKELAHNIRNINSNRNIKQNKLYTPKQYQLFDMGIAQTSV
ncbi:hypothetical protein [Maribacter arcticus]|uniref:hypothetical protein n=1 Tax=Maribacter arcticus TaxID=561365 RepID=UPI0030020BB9